MYHNSSQCKSPNCNNEVKYIIINSQNTSSGRKETLSCKKHLKSQIKQQPNWLETRICGYGVNALHINYKNPLLSCPRTITSTTDNNKENDDDKYSVYIPEMVPVEMDNNNNNKDAYCCIFCQETIENALVYKLKRCDHFFHKRCLIRWTNECQKTSCPLCRKIIKMTRLI